MSGCGAVPNAAEAYCMKSLAPRVQVSVDGDTGQTIISGMGELHLDIYIERMRREYKVLDAPLHAVTSGHGVRA